MVNYKKSLWKMLDHCRGSVEVRDGLDVIATIAAGASLAPDQFDKIKDMGASTLVPEIKKMVDGVLSHTFEPSISLSRLPDQIVVDIVYTLSELEDLKPLASAIREELTENVGKASGEFGSSRYTEALLPALIGDVHDKSLLDAACGLARMTSLIEAKHSFLQEYVASTASLAQRLLIIENKNAELSIGNSLLELNHSKQKYDLVVMEPPLGLRLDSEIREQIATLPYVLDLSKALPTSAGDALWIQFALYHLESKGKAYLVLPQGCLFRGGYDAEVREYLLDNELVDKVVALPSGSLNHTSIEPVLLILDKSKEKGSPIRFVDLRDIGNRNRATVTLNAEDLELARRLVNGSEDSPNARNVTVREIRQLEHDNSGNNLNVAHYLSTDEELVLPSVEVQMMALQQSKQQFEETQEELFALLNQ
ncbi:SAM-dependent methyltransferase [Vibrio diabolicus]|uniref:SAM-dependent methyltransferase n=1 Tax=Vibrio diabolicus TaxID=50719 RepID=UPI0021509499|nr:SAM-dependent methyltransferase [Vibrio diabolicus]UDY83318.1 SAM-dependent methyltransferase [Vibrio diabolicus]